MILFNQGVHSGNKNVLLKSEVSSEEHTDNFAAKKCTKKSKKVVFISICALDKSIYISDPLQYIPSSFSSVTSPTRKTQNLIPREDTSIPLHPAEDFLRKQTLVSEEEITQKHNGFANNCLNLGLEVLFAQAKLTINCS